MIHPSLRKPFLKETVGSEHYAILAGTRPAPRFLRSMPGLPGESQILSGSADVMENLRSSCTGAHSSIRRRADCQEREACGFQLSFQETKRPLPWPLRRILPQMVLGYPSSRLCKAPPPLFRCGEMKVWELLLFVPAPVPVRLPGRKGGLGMLSPRFAHSSGIEMTNGSRWEPRLPSCKIVYLGSG